MLINGGFDLMGPNGAFVLARLLLDYRREVNWPGEVESAPASPRSGAVR